MHLNLEQEAMDLFNAQVPGRLGKYEAAATGAIEDDEAPVKVQRFRAWEKLSFGLHFLFEHKDTFSNPDKLTRAAAAFGEAERLFDNEVARLTARGYMNWMFGHKALLAGSFTEGGNRCKGAEEAFSQILETPGLPAEFRSDIEQSLRQVNWDMLDTQVMRAAADPNQLGEARALLDRYKSDMPDDIARVFEHGLARPREPVHGDDRQRRRPRRLRIGHQRPQADQFPPAPGELGDVGW